VVDDEVDRLERVDELRVATKLREVKSWSSTRAVRNAISFSTFAWTFQLAMASMSAFLTKAPSSLRSRFSSRTLRLNGRRSALPPDALLTASRR
jgi:hypothetical protein